MKVETWSWTDAEEREFARMWRDGTPTKTLCAHFGITPKQAYRKRRHLLLPIRTPGGLPGLRRTTYPAPKRRKKLIPY